MTSRRLALAALTLSLLLPATPAGADSPTGGDLSVAQDLGDRQLTLILRRVTSVPGPLRIDVITHVGTSAGTLTLAATAVSTGRPSSRAAVTLSGTPGSSGATLRVDRAGAWELAVGDGQRTAYVPFVITAPASPPAERLVYLGFLAAGLLLPAAFAVAMRARQLWWAAVPGAGVVAGIAVAVTGALLSASTPLPPQPGLQIDATDENAASPYELNRPFIADYSRPPAQLALVYQATTGNLTVSLTDTSTGLPADDLLVHDGALLHLMIIGPAGRLWHLHPIRTGPGTYQARVTLSQAGHYAVAAELARRGGGAQLLRSATGIDVTSGPSETDTGPAITIRAAHTATTIVSGVPVSVTTTTATAGTAVTLTARAGTTATLQPWLGMLGHLILVGPLAPAPGTGAAAQTAATWAHAHSMGDLTPHPGMAGTHGMAGANHMPGLMPVSGESAADETVAAYGPSLSFTYTFALPGRYRAWIQVERDYRILTVPVELQVDAR
jgi:hypothetical protein